MYFSVCLTGSCIAPLDAWFACSRLERIRLSGLGTEFPGMVTADDLARYNIEALVTAGHLKKTATPKSDKAENEEVTQDG